VIEPRQGTYPRSHVRNTLVTDSIANKRNALITDGGVTPLDFDYFMFIDSDVAFRAEDVLRLLSHGKAVTAAPYTSQGEPDAYEAGTFLYPGLIADRYDKNTTGLLSVDFVGAGFLLVKREVFLQLEHPWFRHTMIDIGGRKQEAGEDLSFCMLCSDAGIDIWCDFDIKLNHRLRTQKTFNWSLKPKKTQITKGVNMANVPGNYNKESISMSKAILQIAEDYELLAVQCNSLREQLDQVKKEKELDQIKKENDTKSLKKAD